MGRKRGNGLEAFKRRNNTASSSQVIVDPATLNPSSPDFDLAAAFKALNVADRLPEKKIEVNMGNCKATQLTPRLDLLEENEPIAVKLSFQEYRGGGFRHAHVAIVNSEGQEVLDTFVNYPEEVGVTLRTIANPGPEKADLLPENGAQPGKIVEQWLKKIFQGREVIVHGGYSNLFGAFYYEKDAMDRVCVINTQPHYFDRRTKAMSNISEAALETLGKEIGKNPSLVTAAQATMGIYLSRYGRAQARKKTDVRIDEKMEPAEAAEEEWLISFD